MSLAARHGLKPLLRPCALTAGATLLVLCAGFGFGGLEDPVRTASLRFTQPDALPEDNALPYIFAEGLAQGNVPKPMYGDWLSSDRPPLQTGIFLSHSILGAATLDYTYASVAAQSLWILALFFMLKALGLNRKLAALSLATCLLSGFAFINTFYVWPKLLAATFVMGAAAIWLGEGMRDFRNTPLGATLAGTMAAFALLSHGGSMFSLIVLALVIFFKRSCTPRTLMLTAITAGALFLPWVGYQKFVDPPGDRLLKWHLAGVATVDSRLFVDALTTAYRSVTPRQWLQNRYANAHAIGYAAGFWSHMAGLVTGFGEEAPADTAAILRQQKFYSCSAELDVLAGGFLAFVLASRKRGQDDWNVAALLWCVVVLNLLLWLVLMFEPHSTVIHQGSYATILLAYTAALVSFWVLSHWAAVAAAAVHVAVNLVLYGALMRVPVAGHPVTEGAPLPAVLLLALVVAVFVLWLLKGIAGEPSPDGLS